MSYDALRDRDRVLPDGWLALVKEREPKAARRLAVHVDKAGDVVCPAYGGACVYGWRRCASRCAWRRPSTPKIDPRHVDFSPVPIARVSAGAIVEVSAAHGARRQGETTMDQQNQTTRDVARVLGVIDNRKFAQGVTPRALVRVIAVQRRRGQVVLAEQAWHQAVDAITAPHYAAGMEPQRFARMLEALVQLAEREGW